MKLLTLRTADALHAGVQIGPHVLDLRRAQEVMGSRIAIPESIKAILSAGDAALAQIGEWVERTEDPALRATLTEAGAMTRFDQARLGPVVPDPAIFLSIGANSRGHLAEMGDAPPPTPDSFFKVRSAMAASGDEIRPPRKYADMLDWEGELCAVVGRRSHRLSIAEAEHHIAGYTLTNDVSARNNVREFVTAQGRGPITGALRMLTQLKNFPGFCPVGPVLATQDEFPAGGDYRLETRVNGELMQSATRADLVFTPAEVLAYYSEFYVFEPGDIFSLGSPPGVGMARKPPRFLKAGDVVEVSVEQVGVLRNRIGVPEP